MHPFRSVDFISPIFYNKSVPKPHPIWMGDQEKLLTAQLPGGQPKKKARKSFFLYPDFPPQKNGKIFFLSSVIFVEKNKKRKG